MPKRFSDFRELKSLIGELPKEAPVKKDTPAKAEQPAKRNRTVTLKSKEEQAAINEGYTKGQRVRMIDSNDEGVISGFTKNGAKIELQGGLTIESGFYGFYVINEEEDLRLRASVSENIKKSKQSHKKQSLPQDDFLEVDLHLERIPGWENVASWAALEYQMDYFRCIMRKYQKHHGKKIVFIHGIGDGRLKDAIRKDLDQVYALSCTYTVGQWQQYGMGATTVTIK